MEKCYILTFVSNLIQHQLEDVDHAANMITSLKEIFGEQSSASKWDTMRYLLNTNMTEDTLMREPCLSMIAMLNTLEVLGVEIYCESQVKIILSKPFQAPSIS
jgi:hypothetical protein